MGAYSAQVIADGASHYWRLGEPSGLVAADSAGSAPGTVSGGVTLGAAGPLADGSTAMTFDGATGKVQTALNVPLVPPFTLECWIRGGVATNVAPVSNTTGADGTNDFYFLGRDRQRAAECASMSSMRRATRKARCAVNDGQWHYVAWVSDGTTLKTYVDGGLDNSQAMARATPSSHPGWIGWVAPNPSVFWLGALAEVAVYPLALTPAQIATHYALRTATGGGGSAPPLPWPLALAIGLAD